MSQVPSSPSIPQVSFPTTGKQRATLTKPIERIVKIADIVIPADRARKEYRGLKELADSISENSLMHPPFVKELPDGKVQLIAGGRRLRACDAILNWETIPVRVVGSDFDDLDLKVAELVENINRSSLTPAEECENLRQIDELMRAKFGSGGAGAKTGWDNKQTAQLVGESAVGVSNKIKHAKLLKDRPDIKELVSDLPLMAQMKRAEDLVKTEALMVQHDKGELKISQNLTNINALEGIKALPDGSVQLHLTDPPFGLTEVQDSLGEVFGDSATYTAFLQSSDNLSTVEVKELLTALAPELYRTCAPGGHIFMFCSMEIFHTFLLDLLRSVGFKVGHQPIIWDKGRQTTKFSGYDFPSMYEPIIFGMKPPERKLMNPKLGNILRYSPVSHSAKTHRFQKPQELLRDLIETSTYQGETVLDCFAGSGATLQAAKTLKRNAIGFEINKENYAKAQLFLNELD